MLYGMAIAAINPSVLADIIFFIGNKYFVIIIAIKKINTEFAGIYIPANNPATINIIAAFRSANKERISSSTVLTFIELASILVLPLRC